MPDMFGRKSSWSSKAGGWQPTFMWDFVWDSREVDPRTGTEQKTTSQKEELESADDEHHPKCHESDCDFSYDQWRAVHGPGSTREQHGTQVCQSTKE